MIRKTIFSVFLLSISLMLTGCWESADVTMHEPGKYLGTSDVSTTDSAALQARFARQQDR